MYWSMGNWPIFASAAAAALGFGTLCYLQAWLRFCNRREIGSEQLSNWASIVPHLQRGEGTLVGFVRDGVCFEYLWCESSLDEDAIENALDAGRWEVVFPPLLYVFWPRLVKHQYRDARIILLYSSSAFS